MAEVCEVPILSSSTTLTVTETPQTLEAMGLTINPSLDTLRIYFEGRWALRPIARMTRDPAGSITATVGTPVWPFGKICLNQFETGSLFRTVSGELTITVDQYECIPVCDFQAEYRGVITKLLPIGWAWEAKTIRGSNLFKLLNVFGKMFSDLHCRALELVNEFYASTCKELCDLWANEALTSSIRECLKTFSLTEQDTIAAVVAKILGGGGYRVQDFVAVAAALGLTVVATDDPSLFLLTFDVVGADVEPVTACDLACSRTYDGPDMNSILAFCCIMDKIGPAQSDIAITIDGVC